MLAFGERRLDNTDAVLLATRRLRVRFLRSDDAEWVAAYRNDPEIAKFQDWELPYTLERAVLRLREQDDSVEIQPGVSASLGLERNGELIGDVYVGVDSEAASAEIGFTLVQSAQGYGYATEAAGAIVDHLLEVTSVHRVTAALDPDNVASMRVLEAIGMQCEGLARSAVFIRGAWVDDLRYAMTRAERITWRAARLAHGSVSLVEISDANLPDVLAVRMHHSQERLVGPIGTSLAQALVAPSKPGASSVIPWFRAICADGDIVGLVMLSVDGTGAEPFLSGLFIDRRHQRRGIGTRAIRLLAEQLRSNASTALAVSWTEGRGSARPFYQQIGFVAQTTSDAGETVARLELSVADHR